MKTLGYNELPAPDRRGVLRILLEILAQPMFALLIGGGIVYLLLGDRIEALLLLTCACLSVVITIVIRSYGLRPDLFAVANILPGEDPRGPIAYAKGALEAVAKVRRHSVGAHETPDSTHAA